MFANQKIAVVVPAYNEQGLIERTISQVPDFVDFVVAVDDASTDHTSKVLRGMKHPRLHTLFLGENVGVGGAIVAGYKKALALRADIVAVMAGDAQMDPADLPALLEPIVRGEAEYAKGDRLSFNGVATIMPKVRFIGNHVLSAMTRYTSGYRNVRDSQCGYTAIRADTLRGLNLDALYGRYGFPNDLLAHLHSARAQLAQVTVKPVYGGETSGISLFTALVRVPLVLLRSRRMRIRRERKGRQKIRHVLQPASQGKD